MATKSKSPFKSKSINDTHFEALKKLPGWNDCYAENHRGAVYWNDLTGEIVWLAVCSNASLLPETWKKISK